jgi:hypothetical protein
MKKFTLLFLILLTNCLFAQHSNVAIAHKNHDESPFSDSMLYKRIKIDKKTPNLFKNLDQAGIDVACGVYFTENDIQIELSEYELNEISNLGITYTVLIEDMTKFYSERAARDMPKAQLELQREKQFTMASKSASVKSTVIKNIGQHDDCSEITWNTPVNFTLPSTFGGCLTYSGMAAELDKMRTLYPNLISIKANASPTNQLTHENRIVYVVKISDNPDTNEAEPQSLTTGMTHAREVSSLMNQIFYMWYLLENYSTDPFIKNLVDNTELYFIPIVNPDGVTYNQTTAPNGGGMQRKNRKPNGGGCSGTLEGVDINRNFGYQYGLDPGDVTICDDTYRGTAAFSEPETQIIRDFILAKNIKTALNHHAYSNLLPHPVNGKANTPTGRENEFAKFCHDMTQYNRYVYGPAPGILYAASGDASDWMTGGPVDANGSTGSGKNVLAVSPENGAASGEGAFWPSVTLITTIAKRAMRMNFINSYYSGKYAKFHDLTQSNVTALTSNLTFGIERLGQTAATYTLTVTPVSSNIVSITSPTAQTGMTILEQRNVTAALVLSPSILANQKIEYKVTLSNGDYTLYEANYVKIYNPTVLFNNTEADVLTKWTQSGTWVTTTSAFNGTTSISDSAVGTAYSATNSTKTLTTTNAISLAGAQKVLIQYYAKWDLERNFDLVQIQATTDNGTSWTTLCGNYTKPTSTTATNPHATKSANSNVQNVNGGGGVLYDGDTMDKWAMEEIVIDATNNSAINGAASVKFRFRMITDSSNRTDGYTTTFDGFYFDDFKVIKQISEPPVAICKNATLALGVGGTLTVLLADVNNNSTDDIAITTIAVSPNTFNCTHRNTTQNVTLTVTDADGQTSTCTATVTITDPNPVAGTVSSNQAICSGTQPANITLTGSTGTIQWQSSTDNVTFTNISGQTTVTLSGSTIGNLSTTRYYKAIITNGNCTTTAISSVVTVTVNPLPTAPTATNSTQYGTQVSTASVADSNGFTTPTFTWYTDNTTTTVLQSSTSNTYLTSVSSTTTLYVSVTNPLTGCESTRTPITVTVSSITWNASNGLWTVATNWTPNIVPTSSHNVLIPSGTPSLNTDFTLGLGNTLTVNGSGGLIVEPNRVLKIAGTANFNNKSILFKSDATGTGIFGELTGTVTGVSNVTVERYISGRRAFRFLTPGVTTITSIYENWQNNGVNTAGIGTHITGGATGGFDVTQTNNPSLHTYNAQATSNTTGFTVIPNTNATILKAGVGYRLLVRGDRNVNLNNASAANMNVPTTLTAKGTLTTGTVTFNTSGSSPVLMNNTTNTQTSGYTLIGNPYVSPVDWNTVSKSGVMNNAYYTWDPTLGTIAQRGRYVVYSANTGTSNIHLPSVGTDAVTNRRYLQSGQAVFVKNAVLGTPATLTFAESNKATNTSYVFRSSTESLTSNNNSSLYLKVYEPNELAIGGAPIDGALALFGTDFSNTLDNNDVEKLNASGENLAFVRDNKSLAIETLAPVVANDELFVKTIQLQANKNYTFQVNTNDFDTTVNAKMVDLYLNTETPIDLTQPSFVSFTTSSDANSYGSERFKIVFNTTALGNGSFTGSSISIYPNPIVNNQFTLALPSSVSGKVTVTISNMLGQQVYNDSSDATPTMQIKPKQQLQEGVYVVSISNNGQIMQAKIIVKN